MEGEREILKVRSILIVKKEPCRDKHIFGFQIPVFMIRDLFA